MSYYALISSLPMLTLDGNAGMTTAYFLSSCQMYVKGKKYQILEKLDLNPLPGQFKPGSLPERFSVWECSLRNAIVKQRANRLDLDPAAYLNKDAGVECDSDRVAAAAFAVSDPRERERILDQARWTKIEELESGSQFSFERLCAYKLKMLIQLKWLGRVQERAVENLDRSTDAVIRSIELKTKQEN